MAQNTSARLSPRELEVARMVAQGLTNREIGEKLFISERTVDGHLEHVREKLGVNTRAQVTAWVVRNEATQVPTATSPAPPQVEARRPFLAHPRAWLAGALVAGLLAAGVGVLRLTEAPAPLIETVVGAQCVPQQPLGCFEAETQPALDAKLSRPTSIAVDSKGTLYIADYGNGRIRRVAGGIMSTIVGGGKQDLVDGVFGLSVSSPSLGYASTVAVDSHDQVYVLTSRNDILEVWYIDGNFFLHKVVSVGLASGTYALGPAPNLPVGGLAITREGVLFVCDRAGNRVMKYQDGTISLYAGGGTSGLGDDGDAQSAQLNWPIGLALDKQENLFIADTGNHRIRRVDHLKGTITTVAGGTSEFAGNSGDDGPPTQARLSFPFGVVVAPGGAIVIADTGNHRLREISAGRIFALAGSGQWGFLGDGQAASQAEFDGPEALALDSHGDLYVADTENQRVREIPRLFGPGS